MVLLIECEMLCKNCFVSDFFDIELIDNFMNALVVELINNLPKSALWIVLLVEFIVTIYVFNCVTKLWSKFENCVVLRKFT